MSIYGNTIATTVPQPDWNQADSTKADYIRNKPDYNSKVSKPAANIPAHYVAASDGAGGIVYEAQSGAITIITLTQAQYDALETINSSAYYIIE